MANDIYGAFEWLATGLYSAFSMGQRIWILIAIASGGALGALGRYGLSMMLQQHTGREFPVATLAANMIGCLCIGVCLVWLESADPWLRDGVRIGFLGALTTFSTYAIETWALVEKGQYLAATGNLLGNVIGGLGAAVIGIIVARAVLGSG